MLQLLCRDTGGPAALLWILRLVIYGSVPLAVVGGILFVRTRRSGRLWSSSSARWFRFLSWAQLLSVLPCAVLFLGLRLMKPTEFRLHFPWSLLLLALIVVGLGGVMAWVYLSRARHQYGRRVRSWPARVAVPVVAVLLAALVLWKFRSPSLEPYADLKMPAAASTAPGLQAEFLGVSTVMISDGTTWLMVDGFFSRPSWIQLLLGMIGPVDERIDKALARAGVSKLDAVLVAHSHHDHGMDSPTVAWKTGALLVGSTSTAEIARGQCRSGNSKRCLDSSRVRLVKHGESLQRGAFHVTIFETPHSPGPIAPGVICEPLHTSAGLCRYQLGESFTFLLEHPRGNVLIVPGANYVPGLFKDWKFKERESKDWKVDVVLLGIGGLGKQPTKYLRRYWNQVVRATGAKLVVPIHWDDFGRPLDLDALPDDAPWRASPLVADDLERTMCVLKSLAQTDGVTIGFLPPFEKVALPPPRR